MAIRVPRGVRQLAAQLFPGVEQPALVPAISSVREPIQHVITDHGADIPRPVITTQRAPVVSSEPTTGRVATVRPRISPVAPVREPSSSGATVVPLPPDPVQHFTTDHPGDDMAIRLGFNPTIGMPTNVSPISSQFDWGGALQDLGGAIVRGGVQGIQTRVAGIVGGSGGGSEPPQGSPTVPGGFVAESSPCPSGTFRNPIGGRCIKIDPGAILPGGAPFISTTQAQGQPVLGHYGVAMTPSAVERVKLRCPRGMVLGLDNMCYNKRNLRADERKWRPGRRPLLTGGEMNAITVAARAAGKLERSKKRIRKVARTFTRAG
jgi:hypothetical protein